MPTSSIPTALALGCLIACASGGSPHPQTRPTAVSAGEPGDWIYHYRDAYGTRFSPLSEINTTNVGTLTKAWTFEQTGVGELTPVAVDGVLYLGIGSKIIAVDGATGKARWTTDVPPSSTGGRRGPVYANGTVYSYSA